MHFCADRQTIVSNQNDAYEASLLADQQRDRRAPMVEAGSGNVVQPIPQPHSGRPPPTVEERRAVRLAAAVRRRSQQAENLAAEALELQRQETTAAQGADDAVAQIPGT